MDELTGLLNSSEHSACKVIDNEIVCPHDEKLNFIMSCKDCIYRNDISTNHTRLKDIIPIILLEEQ